MASGPTSKLVALNASTATLVASENANRSGVSFKNEDASIAVRLGPSTVTKAATAATAGFKLAAGEELHILSNRAEGANAAGFEWYAISESGTPNLGVLEHLEK